MHRGSWKSSSSPRIAGVQRSSTMESTLWGMAPVVAVVLGIVLDSIVPQALGLASCSGGVRSRHVSCSTRARAEIAPASWQLQRTA